MRYKLFCDDLLVMESSKISTLKNYADATEYLWWCAKIMSSSKTEVAHRFSDEGPKWKNIKTSRA